MKKASELTDDEIRVMIAEDQGWTDIWHGEHTGIFTGCCPLSKKDQLISNYPADLNAIHEVENVLIAQGLWVECSTRLGWVGAAPDRRILHATARQRCEAYLITKGLALP